MSLATLNVWNFKIRDIARRVFDFGTQTQLMRHERHSFPTKCPLQNKASTPTLEIEATTLQHHPPTSPPWIQG